MGRPQQLPGGNDAFGIDGERARQVLMVLPEALIALAADGAVEGLNEQAMHLLGVTPQNSVGRHWSHSMTLHEANGADRQVTSLPPSRPSNPSGPPQSDHFVLTRRDGSQRVVQVSVVRGRARRDGQAAALLMRDCTVSFARMRQLERDSTLDHLTNLVNRREFERRLHALLARAREDKSRHVLMFMDLDRFKLINDVHGHTAGDKVLKDVSEALRASVRERDTLGRLGGDEFGLLMEHCLPTEALRAANTLRLLLSRQGFEWCSERLSVGVSIGLASIDHRSTSGQSVWAEADAACYSAKRSGDGPRFAGLREVGGDAGGTVVDLR